jgi:aspartate/methionine/tyrosine aminotransferase
MYPPTSYLEWAIKHGASCKFDLATSGIQNACDLLTIDPASLHDLDGWKKIREVIARANDVPQNETIAALGTAHAVWLAYASLLSPGDELVVEQPAYEPLLTAALGMGLTIKRFDRLENKGFAVDPDVVARAITEKTKAVVISNLHNPSGARVSREALAACAKAADRVGAFLIVDEVYAPFDALCDDSGIFAGSARKLGANVVALASLTKCYGLGPHRIGWMLAHPEVIRRAESAILSSCGMLPLAHANLAIQAFSALPALAKRARLGLAEKRSAVSAWVASRNDLEWHAPAEGLFGFAGVKKKANVREAIERGMREHDVKVVPGEFFELPHGFRIAWSLDEALIPEALARLGRVLDSME